MIRVEAACAILLTAILPLGGPAHRKTEQGNQHYRDGDYDEALRQYTEAQVHAPDSAELFYDLGNVLYRQGEFEAAEELYAKALAAGSSDLVPLAAYNLGNARMAREAYREAVEAYRHALRANPDDPDAKRNLELALRRLEQQEQPQQQQEPRRSPSDDDRESPDEREPQPPAGEDGQDREDTPKDPDAGGEPPSAESRGGDRREDEAPEPGEAPRMSPAEAARLLEGLDDQERENLRKAAQAARKSRRDVEEDW